MQSIQLYTMMHRLQSRTNIKQVNIAHRAITPAHFSHLRPPPFLIFFDLSKNEHAVKSMWFQNILKCGGVCVLYAGSMWCMRGVFVVDVGEYVLGLSLGVDASMRSIN